MQAWPVLAVSGLYLALLFAVAWWGDRRAGRGQAGASVLAYALTLAIYNTSWSFYGSVGRAAAGGLDFLTIYIGPVLVLGPGRRILADAIAAAKRQNAASVADFIAARYGKSSAVAAAVTLVALLATCPYIALQLKAIAGSYDVLTGTARAGSASDLPFWRDTAFAVAGAMALFAMLFGVRHVEASERHRGLMLAVAFESLVKLAAFVGVAAYIVFGMGGGLRAVFAHAAEPGLPALLRPGLDLPGWILQTLIAALSFLCLPHAFHVAVVENERPAQLSAARWLYPGYLAAISLPMLPIALIGLTTFGHAVNPDSFMIALPLASGSTGMALATFLGGLSAATGMVIVASVALATMACNDVIVPLLMRLPRFGLRSRAGGMAAVLLRIRRLAVAAVLALSYLAYRFTDRNYPLTQIGLVSFVAVAQFGPGFLAALYWRRGTRRGLLAGLGLGFGTWAYTLLIPAIGRNAAGGADWLAGGPWRIGWLAPDALFGIPWTDPVSQSAFWSLLANLAGFVAVSLLDRQTPADRALAEAFASRASQAAVPARSWRSLPALSDLETLAAHYVGPARSRAALGAYLARRQAAGRPLDGTGLADRDAVGFTETLIAGAVGAASARVIMAGSLQDRLLSRRDAMAMLGEASEALGSGRRLLEGALESVPQGLCVLDGELRILAWNQRFLDLLGFPPDLVRVDLPLAAVIRFNAERGEYGAEDLKAVITNRDRDALAWPYRYIRERPDGTVLEIVYNRTPGGGYVATYTDVTERHRAAEALERRVRERTEDLQRAKAEAEQANAAKTRFLAAASHDLLQPLNAARLFAAALRETLAQDADGAEPLTRARRLADNLAASLRSTEFLLGDLLDISSLDSGKVRTDVQTIRIGPMLQELALEVSAQARGRGLAVRVVPSSLAVQSDPRLLRRIVQNLLSNAVRYTLAGGVLLGCRRAGGQVLIVVQDTGPGIALEHQAAVFEEFRRLPGGAPGTERGLGLGLAIVDRAARLLGHSVELRSEPGRGTRFSVAVPRADDAAPASAPAAPPVGALAAGRHVLCIDDEPEILRGLAALLEGWGCRVATAPDGDRALPAPVPDVLIVDYHLGAGDDGLAVVQRLRAHWGRPVPALLVTADRSEGVRQAARLAGCEVLSKPVRPAALRRFLAAAALREDLAETSP